METPDELKKWVESLTIAEKRFIKLLGKARSGAKDSQQLELFDWLNQAQPGDSFPGKARFIQNLPTVSNRLKDLMLDGLRLLHKEDNTDAVLRTTLDEIAILVEKKLYPAALRQMKRAKNLALDRCRYAFALQCIEWEQKITGIITTGDASRNLEKLREEEIPALKKLEELRELQHRHELLLALVKQFPYHRDAATLQQITDLTDNEIVYRLSEKGAYLEKALAVNLLGIRDLYRRDATAAVLRYRQLLREWQSRPGWQTDQVSLLLLICKFYQSACFFSPVDWDEARQYITMVNDFKGMPPDAGRDFQRMLYHNQFSLGLNTGKFDSVETLIPEIDQWISREQSHLTGAQQLSFLCNFAVAEFLGDHFASANRFITRILNMPNREARKDIRAFALVLQVVLQYELGNLELNEYLARSGKRHFSKNAFEVNFELIVFKHIEAMMRAGSQADMQQSLGKFISDLDKLAAQLVDAVPLLGLKEIQMWTQSKRTGVPLRTIFLQEVKKNLEALEQTELLKSN
ncbi:MAG: hypothetical protein FD123_117 [Bacteroidetes bacterium]|nr:MAG: hypothetical protein FD123_117 [Bacteroidota bacterium]